MIDQIEETAVLEELQWISDNKQDYATRRIIDKIGEVSDELYNYSQAMKLVVKFFIT